jgi:hypothetical protein
VPGGACGNVPYEGVCSGSTVAWCQNGKIDTFDCSGWEQGFTCGWETSELQFWCVDPATCQSNCAGKMCGEGGCGKSCGTCGSGMSCDQSGKYCMPKAGEACGALTFQGQCYGNVLAFCSESKVVVTDCTESGKLCGQSGTGGSDCIGGGCTPKCQDKQCGSDGCGGTSGSCAQGQVCDGTG